MSTNELNNYSVELKDLRVQLVKASQELNLVSNLREFDERVKQELFSSKDVMSRVKLKLSSQESSKEEADEKKQKELWTLEQMKFQAKVAAFRRSSKEIETMYMRLNQLYSVTGPNVEASQRHSCTIIRVRYFP